MSDEHRECLRVLLVDDDEVDRMAVTRALRGSAPGVSLVEADNADDAAVLLAQGGFDAVLSDLQMPGRDGAWLLAQIRKDGHDVPFIALTGQGDEQTAVALMRAGAADYVVKGPGAPLDVVLLRAIRDHRREQAHRRGQERLLLALEVTGLGTWDVDPVAGRLDCDDRWRALHGLRPASTYTLAEGFSTVHLDDLPALRAAYAAALDPGGEGRSRLTYRVQVDGEVRWIRGDGQVYFSGGRAVRLVGTSLDVTAVRREEEAARRRLEFEQQLLGIVSHDLRNPISAMTMGAHVLVQSLPQGSSLAQVAGRVVSSGQRATRLIRDLLDFTQARSSAGIPLDPRSADIHDICRLVIDEIATGHPGRELRHEVEGDGAGTWDPDRLVQVIGNLLVNAVTYSPATSPVRIASRGRGDTVEIEVHNEGPPIPGDILPALFAPFKRHGRRPDPDRSIGLGLFIVREIVTAHGGVVEARSAADEGTTFRVSLPRGQADAG